MNEMGKTIMVRDNPVRGLAGLVRVGPLLFTAGCDGHRELETGRIVPELQGEAERQCENAYGKIANLLRQGGSDVSAVVRLDHVTSSQDWLPRRQSIRGQVFGRPAPLASTGVAAKMHGINMLTAFAIAVADPADKQVLVEGARYGMKNISAAVRGGPLLFIAGIRGNVDPRTGAPRAEETGESFGEQLRTCYEIIHAILSDAGAGPSSIVRFDSYIRDIRRRDEDATMRRDVLGDLACASTVVGLPLGARGEVEITTLALAPGQAKRTAVAAVRGLPAVVAGGGLLFVGECCGNLDGASGQSDPRLLVDRAGQVERAIDVLEGRLREAGSTLDRVVRLELYLRDINFAPEADRILARRFQASPPIAVVMGAELDDFVEAKLNAIAI